MEIGIYTFAETTRDPRTGHVISAEQRLKDLIEEIELADQVGLDVYGVGERHRPDFAVSAPAVVLAAAAVKTKRIRLTSAVTVLSSDDPVRVFQDFATFIESFPLFGYDLDDYDDLFDEKLKLLLELRDSERVNWQGEHRAPLTGQGIYPRPVQNPLPIWIAVGGTPQSVVRAATLGLPMALAIIGGLPERFQPFVELYRTTAMKVESDPQTLRVSINSHAFIAEDSQEAADIFFPSYAEVMSRIGRERGWPPTTRTQFEAAC